MHLTFDLETLGTGYNAPIVQIGAVKFHEHGQIIDTFERKIDLLSLEGGGFDIDYDTLSWWFSQSDEAIKSVFVGGDRVDLYDALADFLEWVYDNAKYEVWSHATFDPVILNNAYNKVDISSPLNFRKQRDIRTLTSLLPTPIEVERKGVHHNALADALYQAEYISKCLMLIKHDKNL